MGRTTTAEKVKRDKNGFVVMGGFEKNPMIDLRELTKPLLAYYMGTKTITSDKFESGTGVLHNLQIKDTGELVSSWGSAGLDARLLEVADQYGEGVLLRITYQGLSKPFIRKGTKKKVQAHNYEVAVNEAEKIEVSH